MEAYDRIAACAVAYEAARASAAANDALSQQEAVVRARVALAECILVEGWVPSAPVHAQLALDRELLNQPVGSLEAQAEGTASDN